MSHDELVEGMREYRFDREARREQAEMVKEARRLGFEPVLLPSVPPNPSQTSKASREDLFPAFAQGVASTKPTRYGSNLSESNVMPDQRLATNGLPQKDRLIDPGGRRQRRRPGSVSE